MSLPTLWFILIAILFVGYLFLEGFDYGVGMLLPFVGHTDQERRAILATIGPVWDANEVWLITAGGALFAAFPNWYATLFSGFYLGLALLLGGLIVRGVGLEFRSKDAHPRWRHMWDVLIVVGSAIPPVVWGLAMGNLLHGVPINAQMNYVGTFFTLLNPYALVGAVAAVLLFVLHGALYLSLKAPEELRSRAQKAAYTVGIWATVFYFGFVVLSYFYSNFVHTLGVDPGPIPILAGLSMIAIRFLLPGKHYGWAFAATGLTVTLSTASVFLALFPRVMISTLNPHWSLTIYNASSNPYSLKVMTIVAISVLPIVLAYQAWTYWVFRRRIHLEDTFHY
ncbi:MAG: cytochrome d ubiquinol oxidase subunit II [Sulfobacillus benefaciens]|uniref:Cytochrome d ubiquinol oxidase subunit II n=1 Tax=Sulfobacillus benefaciens TaxID=453960 RepID=A0A2T2XBT1_9FIRM|nr:MAG: cytochrome d ubiquinol oxidase subunit II [Sulfobacillus benefaciens]